MIKSTITMTAKQIVNAIARGTMVFDNPIQRGYVWDIKRQSLLIDSMQRQYPIPYVFAEQKDEKIKVKGKELSVYSFIDGKQRLTTVSRFLNDEFALSGLDLVEYDDGTTYDLNGKKFSELPEDIKDDISNYQFTIYYFSDTTEEEVAEMMSRLNNGKVLTGTENARIKCKNLEIIKDMASHKLLTENLSQTALRGYANEDIIMKLALLMSDQCELSTKNVKSAYETYAFTEETVKKIKDTLEFVWYTLESATDDKKIIKRICGQANLITVLYTAQRFMEDKTDYDNEDKISIFADKISQFYDGDNGATISEEYNEASGNATMRNDNVFTRNDELYNYVMAD